MDRIIQRNARLIAEKISVPKLHQWFQGLTNFFITPTAKVSVCGSSQTRCRRSQSPRPWRLRHGRQQIPSRIVSCRLETVGCKVASLRLLKTWCKGDYHHTCHVLVFKNAIENMTISWGLKRENSALLYNRGHIR